jgi:hypothetical protein
MAISPFSVRPASPEGEGRRARLALMMAAVGIVAIVAVYAISPGVRHAVSHAEHSVKHAVGHMLDPDRGRHDDKHVVRHVHHVRLVQPLHARGARASGAHGRSTR